jgi:type II secretory pathway pseudopilin PulG
MKRQIKGFSLLELSVIILILGMITVLLWPFIQSNMQEKRKARLYSQLEQADWALTGYIMAHHRLPCPDTDGDGKEDCAAGSETGTLPYRDLGIADATARQIRYGALKRDEVADPEAETDKDPVPDSIRSVNLMANTDRFYPFLALLGSDTEVSKLATRNTKYGTPVDFDSLPFIRTQNVVFGKQNTLDFCWSLRVAEDPLPDEVNKHVHMETAGGKRQIAYGIALPAAQNALDNPPPASPLTFTPPYDLDDDRVRAVTPGALWSRLKCGEAMASIGHAQPNATTAAVMIYRALFDYEQIVEQSKVMEEAQFLSSVGSVVNNGAKIVFGIPADGFKAAGKYSASVPPEVPDGEAKPAMGIAYTVKAATTGAISASALALAITKLVQSYEKREMIRQRYVFIRGLRSTAQEFAQQLLDHTWLADEQGLYSGSP